MLDVAEKPMETLKPIKASSIDLEKKLKWVEFQDVAQIEALIANPPLRSVVATISPTVARHILILYNKKNRPLSGMMKRVHDAPFSSVTGDTIKFTKSGDLADGQHRLDLCKETGKPLVTHVVFGIEDDVFDILDQGKRRTVADALHVSGVLYAGPTAGAARWMLALTREDGHGGKLNHMSVGAYSVRDMHRFILIEHPTLTEWAPTGLKLAKAVPGWSSAMLQAVLYLIAQRAGKKNAGQFAADWMTGVRIGRNTVFDALAKRIIELRAGNRHIPTQIRAALVIIAWNHWQADIQPTYRAIGWNATKPFPKLSFSKNYAGEADA